MAKSVKWLRKALKTLEQAYDYIAETDAEAAIALVLKIQAVTEQLSEFPMMGRPGRVDGTRELVIAHTPYIVIYRVEGSAVEAAIPNSNGIISDTETGNGLEATHKT